MFAKMFQILLSLIYKTARKITEKIQLSDYFSYGFLDLSFFEDTVHWHV